MKDAPNFHFNLAVGDSLLHGFETQMLLDGGSELDDVGHVYQTEDAELLQESFAQQYHAVVGNPPFITVEDKQLNSAYRKRYGACYRKYSLAVPFMQRFFELAVSKEERAQAGFVGKITANSFMKREFGTKLVEEYIPRWDITHLIDTSGAYIPGHGTPTVILFGTNTRPTTTKVRTVTGIKGEPSTPQDPAKGKVWASITKLVDTQNGANSYVNIEDLDRRVIETHPLILNKLGRDLNDSFPSKLESWVEISRKKPVIGFGCIMGEDEAFTRPPFSHAIRNLPSADRREVVEGELIRDWTIESNFQAIFPYNKNIEIEFNAKTSQELWPLRTLLWSRVVFGGETYKSSGKPFAAYHQIPVSRNQARLLIVFASVATHAQFALNKNSRIFKQSAPIIKLKDKYSEKDHIRLVGLLNSSTACFWMKQVYYPKGGDHVGQEGARVRKTLWDERYDHDGTKLANFPVPDGSPYVIASKLESMTSNPNFSSSNFYFMDPTSREKSSTATRHAFMISLQEELDWQCYRLYGLVNAEANLEWPEDKLDDLPPIQLGERPFEIVMARQMQSGELETTWFERHGSVPTIGIPERFSTEHRKLWERRIEAIENIKEINLIERPEYKRRWNTEPWENRQERALEAWLQNHLEFVLSGRDLMAEARSDAEQPGQANKDPELLSCAQLADRVRSDAKFLEVAALYREREDFDLVKLITELVERAASHKLLKV